MVAYNSFFGNDSEYPSLSFNNIEITISTNTVLKDALAADFKYSQGSRCFYGFV